MKKTDLPVIPSEQEILPSLDDEADEADEEEDDDNDEEEDMMADEAAESEDDDDYESDEGNHDTFPYEHKYAFINFSIK